MMQKIKFLLILICAICIALPGGAEEIIKGYGVNLGIKDSYNTAKNKFALTNVKAAHDDFKAIIESASEKDFVLLSQAISLAEYGFYDLTDSIFSKLDDYEISQHYINDIKNFFYPAKRLSEDDLLYLAEAYSNIMYNNYAQETVLDIINNDTLIKNAGDYAHYILALGYYETKDYNQSLNYITLATSQNNNNINYKILKTKILLEMNQYKKAQKILNSIKNEKLHIQELQDKVNALEQFVLYKTAKNEKLKDYHLGYYYLLEDKVSFAQKVLLNGVSGNKKINSEIYALLAKTFLDTDKQQAEEYAVKSLKTGFETFDANYTLGVIKFGQDNTKAALKYLKRANSIKNDTPDASIKIAEIYQKQEKKKNTAKKLWSNTVKKFPDCNEGYYNLAFYEKDKQETYLKKSLSYNIQYTPAYYALSRIYISRENFKLAESYLKNTNYIDEKDFRYYYYLSQIELQRGNTSLAQEYLDKCKTLNPNYRDIIDKEL